MAQLLLINGPNLNMLGRREPERYGRQTLPELEAVLQQQAHQAGHELHCVQSNHEGVLLDRIHAAAADGTAWILINPGGLTHTSVSLRDALLAAAVPFTEIHITNIHAREPFRHHSYLSDVASGTLVGFGVRGYRLALEAVIATLQER